MIDKYVEDVLSVSRESVAEVLVGVRLECDVKELDVEKPGVSVAVDDMTDWLDAPAVLAVELKQEYVCSTVARLT